MNTTPLQSPASILQNPSPATRSGDAGAPPVPFNQVLSQEVAQRNDARQAADGADGQAAAKTANGGKPAAAGNGKPPANTENDRQAAADAVDKSAKDGQPVTAIPAELLALVASLQRPAGGGAALAAAGDPVAAAGARKPDAVLAAAGGNRSSGAPALTAAGANLTAADGAAASADGGTAPAQKPAGKPDAADAAFAAVQQAGTAQPGADAARQKTLEQALATTPSPSPAQLAPVPVPAASAAAATGVAATGVADRLTPAVGTPAWDAALGQKVVWMVAGAQKSAALTLNPPDLGPLQVVLHVSNSHADATFISAQPEVRQALEAALPRLREMMGDAGIQLGQASVGTSLPNQQQAPGQQAPRPAAPAPEPVGGNPEGALRPLRPQASGGGRGMVDTFV